MRTKRFAATTVALWCALGVVQASAETAAAVQAPGVISILSKLSRPATQSDAPADPLAAAVQKSLDYAANPDVQALDQLDAAVLASLVATEPAKTAATSAPVVAPKAEPVAVTRAATPAPFPKLIRPAPRDEAQVSDAAQAVEVPEVTEVPQITLASVAPQAPPLVSEFAPARDARPRVRPAVYRMPKLRWSSARGSSAWTAAVVNALSTHGKSLPQGTPADIDNWCPAYRNASMDERKAFWAGLISTLVKHESTYRPTVVGDQGKSYGLLQIRPGTASLYRCNTRTGEGLKNGPANLACGVRIMARTVGRDGVVSAGFRGVAADWGPFHSRVKREDMLRWVRKQPYCVAPARLDRPRPAVRPEGLGVVRAASLEQIPVLSLKAPTPRVERSPRPVSRP